MTSKFTRGAVFGFLLRFAVVFGVLIAPWPGWDPAYAAYFQSFGRMIFGGSDGPRVVEFAPNKGGSPQLDTVVTIENRDRLDSRGQVPARQMELDSRSLGWVPTALTVALVAATPIPWRRRLVALASGLVLIHLFIFFTLEAGIWNNSADLSLTTLSGFWRSAAAELEYVLVTQIGASFSVPVVIWILVTFRRQDEPAD